MAWISAADGFCDFLQPAKSAASNAAIEIIVRARISRERPVTGD
jgi:hypothetical protein